uniref:Ig-like domain-containing protein n=1 Tax=Glossina austeni TaxID=7395 RepID=A0A1A9UV13_GLOAU
MKIRKLRIDITMEKGGHKLHTIVSWVRHRDIHLLTVGRYTYTSDQRFEAMHSPHAEDWTLRIRYAQRKDSGTYECQISTTPPIGHSVYLNIVDGVCMNASVNVNVSYNFKENVEGN